MPQDDVHRWTRSYPWSLSYRWGHSALTADFDLSGDTPRLVRVLRPGDGGPGLLEEARTEVTLPLLDVVLLGEGVGLGVGFSYRAHRSTYGDDGGWHRLDFELHDQESGLTAFVEYASPDGVAVLGSRVRLRNDGAGAVTVRSVGGLPVGGLVHRAVGDTYLVLGEGDRGERRWSGVLVSGGEFVGEWVVVALGECFDGALAALRSYRRLVGRSGPDHERCG